MEDSTELTKEVLYEETARKLTIAQGAIRGTAQKIPVTGINMQSVKPAWQEERFLQCKT